MGLFSFLDKVIVGHHNPYGKSLSLNEYKDEINKIKRELGYIIKVEWQTSDIEEASWVHAMMEKIFTIFDNNLNLKEIKNIAYLSFNIISNGKKIIIIKDFSINCKTKLVHISAEIDDEVVIFESTIEDLKYENLNEWINKYGENNDLEFVSRLVATPLSSHLQHIVNHHSGTPQEFICPQEELTVEELNKSVDAISKCIFENHYYDSLIVDTNFHIQIIEFDEIGSVHWIVFKSENNDIFRFKFEYRTDGWHISFFNCINNKTKVIRKDKIIEY